MTGVDPAARDRAHEFDVLAEGRHYLLVTDTPRDAAVELLFSVTDVVEQSEIEQVVDALLACPDVLRALADTTPAPDAPTREALAEVIAEAMEHERFDDAPECPDFDATIGCQHSGGHPDIPGCETCGEFGWPCAPVLAATDAVLAAGVPAPDVAPVTDEQAREQAAAAMQRLSEACYGLGDTDGAKYASLFAACFAEGDFRWLEAARALLGVAALPEEDRRAVDPRRDRWVTWTTASPTGVDDRHRGVFVAEHRGMADVVEDEGSPRCIPLGNLTFEETP